MKKIKCVKNIKLENIFEHAYLVIFVLYLIPLFCGTTLFFISWPWYYDKFLRTLAFFVVLLKVGYRERYSTFSWLLYSIAGFVFVLSWNATGYMFLIDTAILAIGAADIPYKKILKVYFFTGTLIMMTAMLGALTGTIKDLLYFHDGTFRHAFGMNYTTDFATHVLFLALAFWSIYEDRLGMPFAGVMAGLAVFLIYFSSARCSTIISILAAVGVIYIKRTNGIRSLGKHAQKLVRYVDSLLIFAMPLCAGIMISLSFLYNSDNAILNKLNSVLSGRLRLAQSAFKTYGIKLWGTPFDMVGAGGDTVSRIGYNYVDSSYCLILVRYGLVLLITVCIIYIYFANKLKKSNNRVALVCIALVAIHSMIEHHLLEIAFNPFAAVMLAKVTSPNRKETLIRDEAPGEKRKKYTVIGALTAICFIAVLVLGPRLISYARTIVTLLRLYENDRNFYFIIFAIFAFCVVLVFSLCAIRILHDIIAKKKKNLVLVFGAAVSIIVLGIMCVTAQAVVYKKSDNYSETVAIGSNLISKIQESVSDCRIYVDDIPTLYAREHNRLSYRILPGHSNASTKQNNVVLITRIEPELLYLIKKGFYFGKISDQQVIYSNSKEAISILEKQGIKMENCYNIKKDVNLYETAWSNGLAMSESDGLMVEGENRSLIHGPGLTIYGGKLAAEYQVKLKSTSVATGPVATVRLSTNWGKDIKVEKAIEHEAFNENGEAIITIQAEIPNAEGVEFLLFSKGDTVIEIKKISYYKTP